MSQVITILQQCYVVREVAAAAQGLSLINTEVSQLPRDPGHLNASLNPGAAAIQV